MPKHCFSMWFLLLASPAWIAVATPAMAQGPHQRLMHYVDEAGREQSVRSVDDWQRRRAQVLQGMQEVMGPLPAEMPATAWMLRLRRRSTCRCWNRRSSKAFRGRRFRWLHATASA